MFTLFALPHLVTAQQNSRHFLMQWEAKQNKINSNLATHNFQRLGVRILIGSLHYLPVTWLNSQMYGFDFAEVFENCSMCY